MMDKSSEFLIECEKIKSDFEQFEVDLNQQLEKITPVIDSDNFEHWDHLRQIVKNDFNNVYDKFLQTRQIVFNVLPEMPERAHVWWCDYVDEFGSRIYRYLGEMFEFLSEKYEGRVECTEFIEVLDRDRRVILSANHRVQDLLGF